MKTSKSLSRTSVSHALLCASVMSLLFIAVARPNLRALGSGQNVTPSPSMEVKSPIIAMVMAASIDDMGQIVHPGFTFSPNEPQITAIVYVGKIMDSQLKIIWYSTSENGDEKLFEHQIKVKSNDRAFSACKNASGTLALGTYKVVATLEGQTEEMEFDVSPAKTVQNKSSNNPDEKRFREQDQSQRVGQGFSIKMNSGSPLAVSQYEPAADLQTPMQKVAWNST